LGAKPTLIPIEAARVGERRRVVEVSQPKSKVKDGPAVDDDEEITPEYEERVRSHHGLGGGQQLGAARRGAYGDYYLDEHHSSRSDAAAGATEEERRSPERRSEGTRGEESAARQRTARERAGNAGPGMTMGDSEANGEFRPHGPGQGPGEPERY